MSDPTGNLDAHGDSGSTPQFSESSDAAETSPTGHPDATNLDASPLCPQCLTELPPRVAFCPKCTAPVGAFATYDPIQQIYSTGWLYRRAIGGGISTIAFVGMWLIFGPTTLFTLLALVSPAYGPFVDFDPLRWGLALFFVVLQITILTMVTRSYIHFKRRKPGQCAACHYDLANLTEPRCPECGTPFDSQWIADEIEMATEGESQKEKD